MIDKKSKYNPWTSEDEREHPSSAMEWWCAEAFFSSVDGKEKWSVKAVLSEWHTKAKQIGSNFVITLFDQENNKNFFYDRRDNTAKLKSSEYSFNIQFKDSWITGSFPNYEMHFHDPENNIKLDMKYRAKSYPRWVAQDVTGGWLPMGLGFYRYGFIPKCDISGTLTIKNKKIKIVGDGYFEHVWGDFTYHRVGAEFGGLKKTLSTYAKLVGWWIHNSKIRIPNSITFSTENNPFGYDWAWALLDNGWTLFYGNILFWIMHGPAAGSLILSKDGETYEELCNVQFKYNKTKLAKDFDFQYPTEIELTATKAKEKLHLVFLMDSNIREYVISFREKKYWLGLAICEAPGIASGYYFDGNKKIKLNGICKIEPQRQISALGHNTLKIDFLKPPKGFGISLNVDSHFLKKKIFVRIQLLPKLKFNFKIEKI